jgi:hypothetical protein
METHDANFVRLIIHIWSITYTAVSRYMIEDIYFLIDIAPSLMTRKTLIKYRKNGGDHQINDDSIALV